VVAALPAALFCPRRPEELPSTVGVSVLNDCCVESVAGTCIETAEPVISGKNPEQVERPALRSMPPPMSDARDLQRIARHVALQREHQINIVLCH
jgi:hypothetical protein